MTEVRFGFGENWSNYSRSIGEPELHNAIASLRRMLPDEFDPQGKSLIDIGCGSGLHSVAAARLGFSPIVCTDYDEKSVATTIVSARRFGVEEKLQALRDDILDSSIDGRFDVVYSWGVLHHTGDMWRAVRAASRLVKSDGCFLIAIYLKTPFCGPWTAVKRFYCVAPRAVRTGMVYAFHAAKSARQIANGALFREYRTQRGMNRFYDSIDWLGGYPYESASPAEIESFLRDEFMLQKSASTTAPIGLLGSGCAEYTFVRKS
jgi:2-polyprenyl-6-hydroxyphenyl methylase/3-demethylubiquinone-9 3-methyltransferase